MQKNTSRLWNRRGIADLPLLRRLLAIHQKSQDLMDSFVFICICKFASFKNPFTTITALSELNFVFRRFIIKPWRWVRLYLILSMRDIYINYNLNPLTFTSSSRSTEFKDILPSLNISQKGDSIILSCPGGRWVYTFFLILHDVK